MCYNSVGIELSAMIKRLMKSAGSQQVSTKC